LTAGNYYGFLFEWTSPFPNTGTNRQTFGVGLDPNNCNIDNSTCAGLYENGRAFLHRNGNWEYIYTAGNSVDFEFAILSEGPPIPLCNPSFSPGGTDFNGDCKVDMQELADLVQNWLQDNISYP